MSFCRLFSTELLLPEPPGRFTCPGKITDPGCHFLKCHFSWQDDRRLAKSQTDRMQPLSFPEIGASLTKSPLLCLPSLLFPSEILAAWMTGIKQEQRLSEKFALSLQSQTLGQRILVISRSCILRRD